MRARFALILLVPALAASLAGCASDTAPSIQAELPTYTPYPTYTPPATYTPQPTYTSRPTNVPPTATPAPTETPTLAPSPTIAFTVEQLNEKLAEQPLVVVDTRYVVQDAKYKALYPDALSVTVRNNGEHDIRDLRLAFAAWDENGLPVLLKGDIDFADPSYVKQVKAEGVNIIPGDTWGETSGYEIAEGLGIETFTAVVVSYAAFDGTAWENEYYDDWLALYEGQPWPE